MKLAPIPRGEASPEPAKIHEELQNHRAEPSAAKLSAILDAQDTPAAFAWVEDLLLVLRIHEERIEALEQK